MNKFKIGDRVVNIINKKRGIIISIDYSREDVNRLIGKFTPKYNVRYEGNMESLNSIVELEKLPDILDEKEKEYLRNVIKPFKRDIVYIKKTHTITGKKYIEIGLNLDDSLMFPNLKNDTMYKGMEIEKEYTLKDLNLQ